MQYYYHLLGVAGIVIVVLIVLLFVLIFLCRRFKCEICSGYFPGWKVITWIASEESSWDDKYLCKICSEKNYGKKQKEV